MLSHSLTHSCSLSYLTHSLTHSPRSVVTRIIIKMSEHSTVCLHGGGVCVVVVQFMYMYFMHANARREPQKISDGQWA